MLFCQVSVKVANTCTQQGMAASEERTLVNISAHLNSGTVAGVELLPMAQSLLPQLCYTDAEHSQGRFSVDACVLSCVRMCIHYTCVCMCDSKLKTFNSSCQSYFLEASIHPALWKTFNKEALPCHLLAFPAPGGGSWASAREDSNQSHCKWESVGVLTGRLTASVSGA